MWNDGVTTEDRSNVNAGAYTVTVTDKNGCTVSETFIVENDGNLDITIDRTKDATCGKNDGFAAVQVSGGLAPYTVTWNTTPVQTGLIATNLSSGTYIATVVDANGCIDLVAVTINDLFNPVPNDTTIIVYGCEDSVEYCVNLPFFDKDIYEWFINDDPYIGFYNGCIFDTTYSYNLSEGFIPNTGSLTCSSFKAFEWIVNGIDLFGAGTVFTSLFDLADAMTTLDPQGTQWSYDPNTKQMMASGVIANSSIYGNLRTQGACNLAVNVFRLNEGYYPSGVTITLPTNEGCKWVKIISDEGCGDSVYVCFETLDKPIIANTLVINTQCDSATGLVRINMVGGNDNFTYQWTPTGAGTLNATGNQLSDLTAGIYIVKVTDKQTGCSIYDTLVVKNINSPLVVEAAVTPENCTAKDGAVVLTPSNYTYTWLDGFVGNPRNNISAGTYYIHVTNGDDCDNYITVEVGRTNGDLVIDAIVIRKPDCKEANGEVMVIVNGGTNPITITWSDGGTGSSRNNLSSGTYTITAVDANGCTAIKTIVVEDSSATNVKHVLEVIMVL